jgi:PH (Pleckstrin Homology) domain-containing protein
VFRLPRPAYLAVLFLALAVTALVQHPVLLVAYLIPLLAIGFIARTATIVDADGITVRALFGSRQMRWDAVRGISVTGRNVYAVTDQGAVRLPCVRIRDLATVAAVSGGRLPELPQARPKYAPARRRR